MRKIFLSLLLTCQAFATTITSIGIDESGLAPTGFITLDDGTAWGFSPALEDEERLRTWQAGDTIFIAPYQGPQSLHYTLFNLTRESAPDEHDRETSPYYTSTTVFPVIIWPKGGKHLTISEVKLDSGWFISDLYITLSDGSTFKMYASHPNKEWEEGDKVVASQKDPSCAQLLINLSKQDFVSQVSLILE